MLTSRKTVFSLMNLGFILICERITWPIKLERAVIELPQTGAASHTIIGTISTKGVNHIALRKPPSPSAKDTHSRILNLELSRTPCLFLNVFFRIT